MVATQSEFEDPRGNKHPVLTLKQDEQSKYGLSFGPAKAKLILAHIEEIQAFVDEHGGDSS